MEENSQKPSAEEQNEPQNTPTSPNGATDSVEKQEPINTPAEVEIDLETKTAAEEAEEIKKKETKTEVTSESSEEAVDYSYMSIEQLISAYKELSTSDHWLKNHSTIQTLGQIFEEKFHADVEANKKAFLDGGGAEIDFFYKPEYKA